MDQKSRLYRLNSKGQTGLWEGMIILLLLALLVGAGFFIAHLIKGQNVDNAYYENGSSPIVTHNEPNIHPLCGVIFDINGKDKTVKPLTNSVKK